MKKFEVPELVLKISERIASCGGRALLVGGCVRDYLLGFSAKDFDLEVFGMESTELKKILSEFGEVNTVGESFTVYKIGNHLDVALPRRERKQGKGHKGFVVEGDPFMTLEEAAQRRDFTINALLYDPLSYELIDTVNGVNDLNRKLLRMVSSHSFTDDSLRVLRAAQFASRFGLDIDMATIDACKKVALDDLPKERIWGEFEKMLMLASKPSKGLTLYNQLGISQKLFLDTLFAPILPVAKMLTKDQWYQCVDVMASRKTTSKYPESLVLALSSIGISLRENFAENPNLFVAKPNSKNKYDYRSKKLEGFLDSLNINTFANYPVRSEVLKLTFYCTLPFLWSEMGMKPGNPAMRRLSCEVNIRHLATLIESIEVAKSGLNENSYTRDNLDVLTLFMSSAKQADVLDGPPKTILQGRHLLELGLKPSPVVGDILNEAYQEQLEGNICDLEEAKTFAMSWIKQNSNSTKS